MFNWTKPFIGLVFVLLSGCSTMQASDRQQTSTERYAIRTRIIVEEMGDRSARSYGDIVRDIERTEQIYNGLGMEFIVVEMALARPNQEWYAYAAQDAAKYEDTLSIYYTFWRPATGRSMSPIIGMGSLPFGTPSLGVFIYGPAMDNNSLAHEIGHYFGLLHTFEGGINGDFVNDTQSREEYADQNGEEADYYRYGNVMNYHYPNLLPSVTAGQEERMRFYLGKHRKNHVLADSEIRQKPQQSPEIVIIFEEAESDDVKEDTDLDNRVGDKASIGGGRSGLREPTERGVQDAFTRRFFRCDCSLSCSSD
tara:strand:+ start:61461 stop:62387 length:927 start_codon:yes stop_codon:yes gene_type:complete